MQSTPNLKNLKDSSANTSNNFSLVNIQTSPDQKGNGLNIESLLLKSSTPTEQARELIDLIFDLELKKETLQ